MTGRHPDRYIPSLFNFNRQPIPIQSSSRINFPGPRELHGKLPYFPKQRQRVRLAERQDLLPVMAYKEKILRAVKHSDVVIIVAETGAGKSSQVPQFLAEAGYHCVVTQPRRMAAVNLANFVATQMNSPIGEAVGFQHGYGKCCSPFSNIVFLTDGLRLAQELGGHSPITNKSVLIIDEAHEKNMYMETLVAMHRQSLEDPNAIRPKLIIMSATMNVAKMVSLFGESTPVINIPGRTFPVRKRSRGKSILEDAVNAVQRGKNSLIFLPGKFEINQMQNALDKELTQRGLTATVIPLHSKLSSVEQQKAMQTYPHPKIILSTNVAEASLTIPGIDLVIMSGVVKRISIENGVESLGLTPISRFNFIQQRGRAGRTHPGEYIYHGIVPIQNLSPEPPSEIQNSKIEGLILRLLSSHRFPNRESIERLPFPNKISSKRWNEAFGLLKDLNLVGPQGHITTEGRAVACLPVDVRSGKMLVAANQKSITFNDFEILRQAIDVAAVIQSGGVVRSNSFKWRELCAEETDSDAIAQSVVFQAATSMSLDEMKSLGIDDVGVKRAIELRDILLNRFKLDSEPFAIRHTDDIIHQALLESIWAGIDSVYQAKRGAGLREYTAVNCADAKPRGLDRNSVIQKGQRIISGMPFDIVTYDDPEIPRHVRMIRMATRVDPSWLSLHGSQGLRAKVKGFLFNESKRRGKSHNETPFLNYLRNPGNIQRGRHSEY